MRSRPILFGAPYSVYVRIVRLVLEEKGVAYDLEPVDIFVENETTAAHRQRHPFGKIPAFEHGSFRLYEAGAIARYVDEAFPGIGLQPTSPQQRARVNQLVGILDSYVYRPFVWDICVERVFKAKRGERADEERIAAALPKARICLEAISALLDDGAFLAGSSLTLADLHAAPMFDYFQQAREGAQLMEAHPRLSRWWRHMSERPSMIATRPAD